MRKQLLLILFLFSVIQSQSQIVSIDPDTAMQAQNLNTTVTLVNGTIGTGSAPYFPQDVYLQQGANIIYNSGINWLWGNEFGDAYFNIPSNASLGLYDLHVTTYDNFQNPVYWTMQNSFFIRTYAGTIEGDVYFDTNQNGAWDGGEPPLANHHVNITPGNLNILTNGAGHYKAYLDTDNYTVSYNPNQTFSQTSLPLTYSAPVPPSYTGLNFGSYSTAALYGHDLSTWRHPIRCAPAYGYTYININQTGVLPVNGKVTFVHSANLVPYSILPAPDVTIGDTMIWYYDTLSMGETFHVGGNGFGTYMQFYSTTAGQTVWYVAIDSVFDLSGNFLSQYVDSFNFVVTCSCDPNDKNVFPAGNTAQHYTPPNSLLSYTINFQNTGNDTAFNVIIVDSLDVNLDWNTFEVLSSTHPVNTTMDANGVITFTFENIQLPDSNVDEPGSHGAVVYQIQTDTLLPDPTEITNTSYIYFDWNTPVITNTTLNTITEMQYPSAVFSAADVTVCPGYCISYSSANNPGSTYEWTFPGANPAFSTDQNPTNICYISSGWYNASLIVTNALGSDTVTYQDYIEVYNVASQAITQSGDTLFANAGFVTYVWYYNGNIISGATDYFYVATQNGDYHVISWDANGCDVEAAAFNVMTSVIDITGSSFAVYPNPAGDSFEVLGPIADDVSVYNVLGERVLNIQSVNGKKLQVIDIKMLPKGTYAVEIISGDKTYRTSIVKQ
jgi:uncharacterized repeat protein (TIGR01451 family)